MIHARNTNSHSPPPSLACQFHDCYRKFKSRHGLTYHIRTKHPEWAAEADPDISASVPTSSCITPLFPTSPRSSSSRHSHSQLPSDNEDFQSKSVLGSPQRENTSSPVFPPQNHNDNDDNYDSYSNNRDYDSYSNDRNDDLLSTDRNYDLHSNNSDFEFEHDLDAPEQYSRHVEYAGTWRPSTSPSEDDNRSDNNTQSESPEKQTHTTYHPFLNGLYPPFFEDHVDNVTL